MPWINGLDADVRCYDTLSNMKNDASITGSKIAITLGRDSINDGGSAVYIIRKKRNSGDSVFDDVSKIALVQWDYLAELMIHSIIKKSDGYYYLYLGEGVFKKVLLEGDS